MIDRSTALDCHHHSHLRQNVMILSFSLFMLTAGLGMVGPILPLFINQLGEYDAGQAARWSGLIQGITFLMGAVFSPIWGIAGDRYGRKKMVLRAFFGMGLTMGLISLAQTPLQIFIIRFVAGCLGGAISACMALVSSMAPEKKMASTLSTMHTALMAGTVAGPLMGGLLTDSLGFRLCFVLTGVILLACGLLIAFTIKENFHVRPETRPVFSLRDNFGFFFSQPQLLVVAWIFLFVNMSRLGSGPILPLFVQGLHLSGFMVSTLVGSVFAVSGAASAVSVSWWGRRADHKGYKPTLVTALAIPMVCFAAMPFVKNIWQIYAIQILIGLFMAGTMPILQSLIALNTPQHRRGSMYGTVTISHWLGNALGPILAGSIAQEIGFRPAFAFLAVSCAAALIIARAGIAERRPEKSNSSAEPKELAPETIS